MKHTTILLVTAVGTLIEAVAVKVAGDAALVLALELVRTAGDVLAEVSTLVSAVRTVVVTVTHPRLMDARQAVRAGKLTGQADRRHLVRLVCAVLEQQARTTFYEAVFNQTVKTFQYVKHD